MRENEKFTPLTERIFRIREINSYVRTRTYIQ